MKIYCSEPYDLEVLNDQVRKIYSDITAENYSNHSFSPKIDISEDEKNFFFEIELPGFKKEDIKLYLENNILTLKGEKKKPQDSLSKKYIFKQRNFGAFIKKFNFQNLINPEKVTVEFENGVLHIAIEKAINEAPKERQIKVN